MRLRYLFIIAAVMQLMPWGYLAVTSADGSTGFYILEVLAVVNCFLLWLIYRKVLRPIDTLAGGLDMLRAQDWNSQLREVGQPDVDRIARVFNEMLGRLKEQRVRYQERTHFLNLLMESAPIGVIILDFSGREVMRNRAAESLNLSLDELRKLGVDESKDYRTASGNVLNCSCHSFMDRGVEHRFYLAEDISDSVTAAEKAAYEKVIRVMAHEVNNTMAGFTSVLSATLPEIPDEDVREVLGACLQRSGELSEFTRRFAGVVKIPVPELRQTTLVALVDGERRFLESLAMTKGVTVRFEGLEDNSPEIPLDSELLVQVMVNIVKNAVESIQEKATSSAPEDNFRGEITITVDRNVLTVTDNGKGISAEKAPRLFTPFYTDKPRGQGIGLMFIREVLMAHRARFSLSTSPVDGLTRFVIQF